MTCIVGLIAEGKVFIGGDSAGVTSYRLQVRRDKKVFKNGPYLIGYTSSFRMGQLLRYAFAPPIPGEYDDLHRFMCTTFVDAVRDCLDVGGYSRRQSNQESAGTFLVGYGKRLFRIDEDYQVAETLDGFDAIGAGSQVALGALYACQHLDPKERVFQALLAAERFNAAVRAPFIIQST
jgi:ATP-dependent protease HslVU (ClpYQ) peptidase subunit